MKQTITEKDLDKIVGRFILQLDIDKPTLLTDRGVDLEFYLIKRVNFIMFGGSGIIATDLFGNTMTRSKESFIEMFNDYLGDSKGLRYHRLLHSDELQLVFDFLKKRNY